MTSLVTMAAHTYRQKPNECECVWPACVAIERDREKRGKDKTREWAKENSEFITRGNSRSLVGLQI